MGLTYEADRRHVDILQESLGLNQANAVATPGVKEPVIDYETPRLNESSATIQDLFGGLEPSENLSSPQTGPASQRRRVQFNLSPEYFNVIAYGVIYGEHPRRLASTSEGMKLCLQRPIRSRPNSATS